MRILVDIKDPQIKALDDYVPHRRKRNPRSALIRQAIDELSGAKRQAGDAKDAFGLWGDRKVDGLDYQEQGQGRMVKGALRHQHLDRLPQCSSGSPVGTRGDMSTRPSA